MNKEKNGNRINGKVIRNPNFKKKKVKQPLNSKKCVQEQGHCLNCQTKTNLSAHHIAFGDGSKDDSLDNLITLCLKCHEMAHGGVFYGQQRISGDNFMIKLLEVVNDPRYSEALEFLERRKKD